MGLCGTVIAACDAVSLFLPSLSLCSLRDDCKMGLLLLKIVKHYNKAFFFFNLILGKVFKLMVIHCVVPLSSVGLPSI